MSWLWCGRPAERVEFAQGFGWQHLRCVQVIRRLVDCRHHFAFISFVHLVIIPSISHTNYANGPHKHS